MNNAAKTDRKCYTDTDGYLVDYRTGLSIRKATAEEIAASDAAAARDGGRGVISVDVSDDEDAALS
jgi:hypothetical protein